MIKRVLIAASVAAAFAPSAFADVTVYGSLRSSVEYSRAGDLTQFRLVDEKSRLGFKGEDKLDNGLTMFWKSEERLRVGGKGSTSDWAARDQVIGLKGDFGVFTAGKTTSAYADATYLSPVLDNVWGISDDSNLYNQGVNGVDGGSGRTPALKYESPSFGGFAFALSAGDFSKTTVGSKAAYAAVANYSNSLFNAGAAYQHYKDATVVDYAPTVATAGTHSDSFLLGAGVKPISGVTISAHWERVKNKFTSGDTHQDNFGLGAEYEIGKWAFHGYTYQLKDIKGTDASAKADSGAKHYVLTTKYALSKNTSALVAVNYMKTEANTVDTQLGNGADAGKNGNAKAISLGLRTDF